MDNWYYTYCEIKYIPLYFVINKDILIYFRQSSILYF